MATALSLMSVNALAQSKSDFEAGVAHYKNRNYSAAIKSFESELQKGDAKPEVYSYLGHSYYAIGDRSRAIKRYQEMATKFKGEPAEQKAIEYIRRIDPSGRYGGPVSSGRMKIESLSSTLPGHPPVDAATVAFVRTTITRLPAYVQKLLDSAGTTIYVGANAVEKWPNDWKNTKVGSEHLTMSQEPGRTVGSDIYIWERPTETGSNRLDYKFDNDALEKAIYSEVGHIVAKQLGNISTELGFKEKYDIESKALTMQNKHRFKVFLQEEGKGAEELAAMCVAHVLSNNHAPFFPEFKGSAEWVNQRLEAARTGRASLLVSLGPKDKKKTDKPINSIKSIQTATAKVPEESKDKDKSEKPAKPDFIPVEDKVPYWADVVNKPHVNGTLNGRPTPMMIDTGAYKVAIGWEILQRLGIKTPEGKATDMSSGAGGSVEHWEMPIEIQIGKIRKTVKASIMKGTPFVLVGQPFLEGMTYRIDNRGGYIHFLKKGTSTKHMMAYDAIEVPYRMSNGNLMVQAKINDIELEMNFDTGAHNTILSMADADRVGLLDEQPVEHTGVAGIGGRAQVAYRYVVDNVSLGSKKQSGVSVLVTNIGHSVLGQNFFGASQFIVDSEKQVIRFSRR